MSFTVFIYNATVLLIQPNPTHGWTQPMSISVAYTTFAKFCDTDFRFCMYNSGMRAKT